MFLRQSWCHVLPPCGFSLPLALSWPFFPPLSPPYVLSIHSAPFYRIQALHLLHAGGLRWQKDQVVAVACRWVLCCSGWKERKHLKANEKPQSVWQLRRGEFGLANCGLRQMWGSCWTACCPWHLHLKNNKENVEIEALSILQCPQGSLLSIEDFIWKWWEIYFFSNIIWNGKRKFMILAGTWSFRQQSSLVWDKFWHPSMWVWVLCIQKDQSGCAVRPQKPGLFLWVTSWNNRGLLGRRSAHFQMWRPGCWLLLAPGKMTVAAAWRRQG